MFAYPRRTPTPANALRYVPLQGSIVVYHGKREEHNANEDNVGNVGGPWRLFVVRAEHTSEAHLTQVSHGDALKCSTATRAIVHVLVQVVSY